MQGKAYVFLNRNGAPALGFKFGHVGGAFRLPDGQMRCFGTENLPGTAFTPAQYKSCWSEDCPDDLASIIKIFQKPRSIVIPPGVENIKPGTYTNNGGNQYTDWKMLEIDDADPDQANGMLRKRSQEDYHFNDRNCENDVYDVLHDEGSGYGISAWDREPIYMGWVQSFDKLGPTAWFDNHIRATDSGTI
jgi:hypothetical protein